MKHHKIVVFTNSWEGLFECVEISKTDVLSNS
jgi:hypothetical protein